VTRISGLPNPFEADGRTEVSQGLDLLGNPQTFVVVNAWLLGLLVVGVVLFLFP
jgi:hypothetical protein